MDLADLQRKSIPDLLQVAAGLGVTDAAGLRKPDIVLRIEQQLLARDVPLRAEGVLEVTREGHGFVRSLAWSYVDSPDDLYVTSALVRRFGLRTGDHVTGEVRPPRRWERYLALFRLDTVNGEPPEPGRPRLEFETLRPRYPDQRLRLENGDLAMRVVDLVAPIGKGQRGLIVAPPRAGKTILLQKMANAIADNHPEVTLIVLLIDERPEEVTDFQQSVPKAEVVSSTFDERPARHVQVAEMVIERAKRLVEAGRDVVILLDSITRLARAHNAVLPVSGKILSGGLDAAAMQKPKRFFGSARRIDDGGSLTIIATALVETGSRMDDVIFEEFKGTGNMELVLSRDIANRRIYPAVDINRSGTRREELLQDQAERNRTQLLRGFLGDMTPDDAIHFLLRQLVRSRTNREFFHQMAQG